MAMSLACGKERYANPQTWGRKLEQRDSVTDTGETGKTNKPAAPTGETPTASAAAPVETLLQNGLVLPARLKADTLTISFHANVEGATFDCASGATAAYLPCDGSSYSFGRLNHGQSYMLRVRARSADGFLDQTPLIVSFMADLLTGDAPTVAPVVGDVDAVIPGTAGDLPQAVKTGESTSTKGRALQVGSYFAVVAPADHQVTSYATNKNYALTERYFRLMPSKLPCTGTFEQEVAGPEGSGTTYCEATPSEGEWQATFATGVRPVAKNHVELVRASPEGLEEKLEVAAFDQDSDPAEARLGLASLCRNANYQGETQVALLSTFYGEMTRQLFHWCQARDENGAYWWIGSFAAIVSRSPNPARLTVIYAVNVRQGIFSGQQFATYAERRLPRLIIPIALPSGTH